MTDEEKVLKARLEEIESAALAKARKGNPAKNKFTGIVVSILGSSGSVNLIRAGYNYTLGELFSPAVLYSFGLISMSITIALTVLIWPEE